MLQRIELSERFLLGRWNKKVLPHVTESLVEFVFGFYLDLPAVDLHFEFESLVYPLCHAFTLDLV